LDTLATDRHNRRYLTFARVLPFATAFKTATVRNHDGSLSLVATDVPLTLYDQEPLSILVNGTVSGLVFTGTVPGASIVKKGRAYTYVARSRSGIQRVVIRESRTLGLFQVTVSVGHGWPAEAIVDAPGGVYLQVNVGGKCFFGHPTKLR
jgi:hypothetical protein